MTETSAKYEELSRVVELTELEAAIAGLMLGWTLLGVSPQHDIRDYLNNPDEDIDKAVRSLLRRKILEYDEETETIRTSGFALGHAAGQFGENRRN